MRLPLLKPKGSRCDVIIVETSPQTLILNCRYKVVGSASSGTKGGNQKTNSEKGPRNLEKPCFMPILSDFGEQTCAPRGSKMLGWAFLPEGEKWPTCGSCERPMPLFVQLNLAEIPNHPTLDKYGREGLVQLFMCTSADSCDTWEPDNTSSKLCRFVAPSQAGAVCAMAPAFNLC
eukprot:m.249521 g.249521  ORF g.249521 m.249521 type:complete len:175 (+) comp15428_c0_seq22:1234-1758(+)